MKHIYTLLSILCLYSVQVLAQTESHSTMFMFNKLLYNPGYTGSRDVTSMNAFYRDQWNGIKGAPKSYGFSFDAPVGNYDLPFREVALGVRFSNEQIGVERKQEVVGYYAYRIKLENESVLSFGLEAGTMFYLANYNQLNPYQQGDPNLANNVNSVSLPNFGAGVFWHGENYYVGASVPNIVQNYIDKAEKNINDKKARQVRGYYANGGYAFHIEETFDIMPQAMVRYSGNSIYQLPVSCDLNLSFVIDRRVLFGFTYRTDKSFEGILHIQASKSLNIGYAYDYLASALSGYNNGAHEFTIGVDIERGASKYDKPHFMRLF